MNRQAWILVLVVALVIVGYNGYQYKRGYDVGLSNGQALARNEAELAALERTTDVIPFNPKQSDDALMRELEAKSWPEGWAWGKGYVAGVLQGKGMK